MERVNPAIIRLGRLGFPRNLAYAGKVDGRLRVPVSVRSVRFRWFGRFQWSDSVVVSLAVSVAVIISSPESVARMTSKGVSAGASSGERYPAAMAE